MKRKAAKTRRWATLSTDALAESTAAYGREMAVDDFGPLTSKARAKWARARRKPGRPRRGKGAKVISVSVEKSLLSRSDMLARDLGVTRAGLIERGLKAVLAAEGKL